MRKLLLSVSVIAASGLYVAMTAMGQSDGLQRLIDRMTFRPAEPEPPLDLGSLPVLADPSSTATAVAPAPPPATEPSDPTISIAQLPSREADPQPVPLPLGRYRDGTYTGGVANAYFGLVQVRAHVAGGELTSVDVLAYPADRRTSRRINDYALPLLQREAVERQDADVDIISGATLTAVAYMRSLGTALSQAR
jgi:uncharacterized protein with FMN-binding domain